MRYVQFTNTLGEWNTPPLNDEEYSELLENHVKVIEHKTIGLGFKVLNHSDSTLRNYDEMWLPRDVVLSTTVQASDEPFDVY